LRNYHTEPQVWGGDPACEHEWREDVGPVTTRWKDGTKAKFSDLEKANAERVREPASHGKVCANCGAWLGELGLERSPDQYIEHLALVFAEVRRVLRPDGSLWIVIGDSWASGKGTCFNPGGGINSWHGRAKGGYALPLMRGNVSDLRESGLKPKDLAGIPWRLAFALQAQGWWWRSTNIWHKPNCLPYSGKDRPTCSHEYVLQFTKSATCYWDVEATREPLAADSLARSRRRKNNGKHRDSTVREIGNIARGVNYGPDGCPEKIANPLGRQIRSVRTVSNPGTRRKHFAVYPVRLIEPYIMSGTSERGCCQACGAPWKRIIEWIENPNDPALKGGSYQQSDHARMHELSKRKLKALPIERGNSADPRGRKIPALKGWEPACKCNASDPVPCRVLDPFAGLGTTGIVCERFNRDATLIDLNPDFIRAAQERLYEEGHPLIVEALP
jgi:DNA modification methylase